MDLLVGINWLKSIPFLWTWGPEHVVYLNPATAIGERDYNMPDDVVRQRSHRVGIDSVDERENALRIIRFDSPERIVTRPPLYELRYRGANHEGFEGGSDDSPVGSRWFDVWGTGWHKVHAGVMGLPEITPLARIDSLRQYNWPDPDDERICEKIYRLADAFSGGDRFLAGSHRDTLWEKAYMLVGMENMMMYFLSVPATSLRGAIRGVVRLTRLCYHIPMLLKRRISDHNQSRISNLQTPISLLPTPYSLLLILYLSLILLAACVPATPAPTPTPVLTATPTLTPSPTPTPAPTLTPTPIPPMQLTVIWPEQVSALQPVPIEIELAAPPGVAAEATVTAIVLDPSWHVWALFHLWPQEGDRYAAEEPLLLPLEPAEGDWRLAVSVNSELRVEGERRVVFRPAPIQFRDLAGALPAGASLRVPHDFFERLAQGDSQAGGRAWRYGDGELALWWAPGPAEPLLLNNAVVMLEATHDPKASPQVPGVEEIEWQGRTAFLFREEWLEDQYGTPGGPAEAWVVQGPDYHLYVLRLRALGTEAIPPLLRQVGETFAFSEE